MRSSMSLLLCTAVLLLPACRPRKQPEPGPPPTPRIGANMVYSLTYTVTDQNGDRVDRRGADNPLTLLYQKAGFLPDVEEALTGKAAGERVSVSVPPERAYGEHKPELLGKFLRSSFKSMEPLSVGRSVKMKSEAGNGIVRIVTMDRNTVTVDGNNPLAGKTLNFDIAVVSVRTATAEEIRAGRPLASTTPPANK